MDPCFSETLRFFASTLIPVGAISAATVAGIFALRTHDRAARQRVWVEHRLKLLTLAHEAAKEMAVAAADAQSVLVDLINIRRSADPLDSPEAKACWSSRAALKQAAVHLPPELESPAAALFKAYGHAHDSVNIALGTAESDGEYLLQLRDLEAEVDAWMNHARDWKNAAWEEARRLTA